MLIKQVLDECDEVIIAVASAQYNYLSKDPFTAGERIEMIHGALKEEGIDLSRCYIIPLVNDENNARWFLHLKAYLPRFDVVYSGNAYVRMLLKGYVEVRDVKLYDRSNYNASKIRELMLNGDDSWKQLVPNAIKEFIEAIDGVNRLKIISYAESKPQEW